MRTNVKCPAGVVCEKELLITPAFADKSEGAWALGGLGLGWWLAFWPLLEGEQGFGFNDFRTKILGLPMMFQAQDLRFSTSAPWNRSLE